MTTCNEMPYNINNLNDFTNYNSTTHTDIDYTLWLSCLNKNMFNDINTNIMDTNKLIYTHK
jgi:hypothetical protein